MQLMFAHPRLVSCLDCLLPHFLSQIMAAGTVKLLQRIYFSLNLASALTIDMQVHFAELCNLSLIFGSIEPNLADRATIMATSPP